MVCRVLPEPALATRKQTHVGLNLDAKDSENPRNERERTVMIWYMLHRHGEGKLAYSMILTTNSEIQLIIF